MCVQNNKIERLKAELAEVKEKQEAKSRMHGRHHKKRKEHRGTEDEAEGTVSAKKIKVEPPVQVRQV